MRQALNYATDKQAIVKAVFLDSGSVAKSPIPSTMLGYKKDLPDYDYDPQKAKALLQAGGSGARRGSDPVVNAGPAPLQPKLKTHCRNDPKRLGESGGESQNCQL
ncbi:ABC transporter substrate-binding protein [Klebsiella pneumoniae subsp. pneumoniae]|nr:ABC transporter substrate-binding protein [Klebsiella pneumoniae subsp. pneumoniae]